MRNFSLMSGAQTCFGALSNLAQTRDKTPEHQGISKIDFSDIFFAKVTLHG
jgi:hypothetical protein